MTKIFLHIIMLISALVPMVASAQQPAATITAKADSTTTLVMGDRTTINLEVLKNSHDGSLVSIPDKETDYFGLELVGIEADSTDLGNGRVKLVYHLTFQAFEPNDLITLPPFTYVVNGDSIHSDILTYKVLPVELSPQLGNPEQADSLQIHPDETVLTVPSKWYDAIPDWIVWVLIGAALAALAVVLYLLYRKNGPKLFVKAKKLPPYEQAINDLEKLKNEHLIESGLGKDFYTRVTDIWRKYLEGRFGISAMEMTSTEILKQLRSLPETHLSAAQMEQVLQISDFVKFAALNPTSNEMVDAYNTIYSFVESSRPSPEQEKAEAEKKSEAKAVNKKKNPKDKK